MTEPEWQACGELGSMLRLVAGRASERKLRLFACACARTVWQYLNGPQRQAIETAERVADGLAGHDQLALHRAQNMGVASGSGSTAAEAAAGRVAGILYDRKHRRPGDSWADYSARMEAARTEAEAMTRGLARCVFAPFHDGDPERPFWRTADVLAVARGAYADQTFPTGALVPVRLTILADALEDAGCADDALLSHLRGPGPHVRGCWALDLILDKK